jgi:hypothetical protein
MRPSMDGWKVTVADRPLAVDDRTGMTATKLTFAAVR